MLSKLKSACCAAVLSFGLGVVAQDAQAFDDAQSWNAALVTAKVANNVTVTAETHFRFFDDVSMLGQFLFRPSVNFIASKYHSYALGYAYAITRPITGGISHEHRLWQQVAYNGLKIGKARLQGRTRLEQRFVEGRADTGWRLRQLVRGMLPINASGSVQALLWNETFVGLNKTVWGQRANLDQTRTLLGVAWKMSDHISLEPGVMHQHIFRNGPGADNIVLSVNLVANF